jgi:hypothetical protein
MKVRVLDCHILEASQNEAKYCLFEASADLINKTRERFFFRCRKELGDKIKIREPAKVRLLIPKSSLESRTNILVTVWPKVFRFIR